MRSSWRHTFLGSGRLCRESVSDFRDRRLLMAILERHRDEVAIQGGELPEILLPTNCPGCGIALAADELRAHNYVCTHCGHHFRLGADVWIPLLADKGSWLERWSDVRSHDLLNWTVPKPYQETVERLLEDGLNEAVRT